MILIFLETRRQWDLYKNSVYLNLVRPHYENWLWGGWIF